MNLSKVKEVLSRYEKSILKLPGVVGVSTGICMKRPGEWCIRVYANKAIKRGSLNNNMLPEVLDEVFLDMVVSGDMHAF